MNHIKPWYRQLNNSISNFLYMLVAWIWIAVILGVTFGGAIGIAWVVIHFVVKFW